MYFKTFEGVFQAVESGLCEYGMLPIENSSYGSVTQVYDLMAGHRFHIARDYKLKINHQLLVKPGTELSGIKEIFSHSQAPFKNISLFHFELIFTRSVPRVPSRVRHRGTDRRNRQLFPLQSPIRLH